MKTLTIIVIIAGVFGCGISHPFFGINVQITGADYSLSPKISANFANATSIASKLITPSAPILSKNLYYQNSMLTPLNDFAYQFVYGARNSSMALMYVFNNLTAAAADNTKYPGVFANLNASIANALVTLMPETMYVQPFAVESFSGLFSELTAELTKLLELLNAIESGIFQFKLSGLSLTSANVLKNIPAPADVTNSLRKLLTISSNYAANISFATIYMNNSYNVLTFNDATFASLENQLNATLKARDAMTNATETYLNQTLSQITTNMVTFYTNFKKSLPANYTKNADFMKNLSDIDNLVNDFGNSIGYAKDSYFQQFKDYKLDTTMGITEWYQSKILGLNSLRASLFMQLMFNKKNLACGQTLVSTADARFKAMGGPSNALFGTQPDANLFKRINATIQAIGNQTSPIINRVTLVLHGYCTIWINGELVYAGPCTIYIYNFVRQMINKLQAMFLQPAEWFRSSAALQTKSSDEYINYLFSVLDPIYKNYTACIA